MKITSFKLQNALLKPLIPAVYLLERAVGEAPESYIAFPGVHHFITITDARANISDVRVNFSGHRNGGTCLLISNFEEPHYYTYTGPVREWNICFNPLALHYFFENIIADAATAIHALPDIPGLQTLAVAIRSADHDAAIHAIGNFLLARLTNFRHPFLNNLLEDIITAPERPVNFSAAAKRFGISRHTLHVEFRRYVGTTPLHFEKILRFRRALAAAHDKDGIAKLTNISGQAEYYDQSHMIRDFRALTGLTPKVFYKKLPALPGGISWIFEPC